MSVITVSSSFGAGGSVVASQVGAMTGWDVINMAIPAAVSDQLTVPLELALENDEAVPGRFWRALVRLAAQIAPEARGSVPIDVFTSEDSYRTATDNLIREIAKVSDCVIVGRAAAVVLGDRADCLHVRVDGPRGARVRQAVVALHLTETESNRRLDRTDRARKNYVRHYYNRDWNDPTLYHVVLDSTAIPIKSCAQIVLEAARGRGLISARC